MDDSTIRKFFRAADQRLTAANWLLDHGMNVDAMYLAGYTVECALKGLVLRRTPVRRRKGVLDSFRGRRGHSYEMLRAMLRRLGCVVSPEVALELRRLASWSTDMRYEVAYVPREAAEVFLNGARKIRDWAKRS